jgi:hypothetical protein
MVRVARDIIGEKYRLASEKKIGYGPLQSGRGSVW